MVLISFGHPLTTSYGPNISWPPRVPGIDANPAPALAWAWTVCCRLGSTRTSATASGIRTARERFNMDILQVGTGRMVSFAADVGNRPGGAGFSLQPRLQP